MSRTKSPATIEFETLTAQIKTRMSESPRWVEAAILALYAMQTSDEQVMQETGVDNKRGFNKPDARRMSFVANFLQGGGHLTREKALNIYAPKLSKYSKQLARMAMEKKAQQAA